MQHQVEIRPRKERKCFGGTFWRKPFRNFRVFRGLIFLFVLGSAAARSEARENVYDVLGKTLGPLVNVFVEHTDKPERALRAEMRLVQMTSLPAQFVGSKVDLAVEYPDKLILRGPVLGEQVTLCRDGQKLWGAPGAKLQAMIDQLGELPKRKKKFNFGDFELPFPEKQLVFLPVLFQTQDRGDEAVNGIPCRVLEVALMPQIAHSLGVEEWAARAWITADYKIAKLELTRPGWEITVSMNRLDYCKSLAPETWTPAATEAADMLTLDPPQFKQIWDAVTRNAKSSDERR